MRYFTIQALTLQSVKNIFCNLKYYDMRENTSSYNYFTCRKQKLFLFMLQPEFSEREKKHFREAFELFDRDGSGFITTEEIGVVMRRLGQNPSPSELEDMIRDVDADGSGHIDFNEFLVMMSQTKEKGHQAELRQAFRLFDSDGDGFITFDDLKRVMRNCGESLSETELKDMFTKADINRDNLVDMKEFTRIVSND